MKQNNSTDLSSYSFNIVHHKLTPKCKSPALRMFHNFPMLGSCGRVRYSVVGIRSIRDRPDGNGLCQRRANHSSRKKLLYLNIGPRVGSWRNIQENIRRNPIWGCKGLKVNPMSFRQISFFEKPKSRTSEMLRSGGQTLFEIRVINSWESWIRDKYLQEAWNQHLQQGRWVGGVCGVSWRLMTSIGY